MFGPKWWAGPKAKEMSALLYAQIQLHRIEVKFTRKSEFVVLPKNTRVRSRDSVQIVEEG
jgi:hypothetical protein